MTIGPEHKVWIVEYEISYEMTWVAGIYTNEKEARAHAAAAPVGKSWLRGGIDGVEVYEMPVYSTYADFKNDKKVSG